MSVPTPNVIRAIRTIKMADFAKAKFAYLVRFEEFKWMSYLTIQHLVHENLIRVLVSNAILEQVGEPDKDPCRIVVINTFVTGVSVRVIHGYMATTFDMSDSCRSDEHEGFPMSMLIPNNNILNLPLYDKLLHLFISHFFQPIGSKHTTVRQIDY